MHGAAAEHAIVQRFHHFLVLAQRGGHEAAEGSAVVVGDHHVLGHVHESAGEVTGVSGLQRGIGQTLTGTVGGDEVLQDGQTLLEVREDGVLDDVLTAATTALLRLGHQSPHAGELADLLLGTTGTGVHHHVDGVEALVVLLDALHQVERELAVGVCPDVDGLVVALVVGDETHVVVTQHLVHLRLRGLHQLVLLVRHHNVQQVEGQASAEGAHEAEFLDVVQELRGLRRTALLHHAADDVAQ